MRQASGIAGLILLNLVLAALLYMLPLTLAYGRDTTETFTRVCILVAFLNLVESLVGSVFILLALAMLAHRLIWPLICRPLYALRERGVRRRVFAAVGVALLTYAGVDMPQLVRQLIEKGAG